MTTQAEHDYAADMGFIICGGCGTTHMPLPGFQNNGHQCDDDGTKPEYAMPSPQAR